VGGGFGESMPTHFVCNNRQKHAKINNKNWRICARFIEDTENNKHYNHEIINIENNIRVTRK
jgi:hypothetical protein